MGYPGRDDNSTTHSKVRVAEVSLSHTYLKGYWLWSDPLVITEHALFGIVFVTSEDKLQYGPAVQCTPEPIRRKDSSIISIHIEAR